MEVHGPRLRDPSVPPDDAIVVAGTGVCDGSAPSFGTVDGVRIITVNFVCNEVLAAIGDESSTIVDTLPAANFTGEMAMYERPGHIPTAITVPCFEVLDESGRLEPGEAKAQRHGGDPRQRIITYCGGGIAASLNAYALHRSGFRDVAIYAASLQQWAADPCHFARRGAIRSDPDSFPSARVSATAPTA